MCIYCAEGSTGSTHFFLGGGDSYELFGNGNVVNALEAAREARLNLLMVVED